MTQLTRKQAILAKIETSYGTDSVPTGGANAILVKNISATPLAATLVSRDVIRSYLGNSDQLSANKHVELSFDVEIAGAGAAGSVPAYGPLLRACGLSETESTGVNVVYAPISDTFESLTIYHNMDGVLHKLTGARGTVELDFEVGQIPAFKFKFVGVYNPVTDAALPTTDYSEFQTPLVANNGNTGGFSLFGYTGNLQSLNVNLGVTADFRPLIGTESVIVTDRATSGQCVFEATSIANLDIFSKAVNVQHGALSLIHGNTSGNKVRIDAPKVSIGNPTYSDSQGVNMINVPLSLLPNSGNDELTITVL